MAKNNEPKIVTPEARLLFPNLFEPTSFEGQGKETYNAILVFPNGTDISALVEAVRHAGTAAGLKAGARNPIRDGNEKAEEWGDIFKDAKYIRVSSIFEPVVVDRRKNPILDKSSVYSGNYARAVVRPFAYDTKGNKGVSFGFDAIQITREGEHLGGGAASAALFDDLPDNGYSAPEDLFGE